MPEHFRAWLYQIAHNTTIDFLKESRRFVPLEDSIINREAGKSESWRGCTRWVRIRDEGTVLLQSLGFY